MKKRARAIAPVSLLVALAIAAAAFVVGHVADRTSDAQATTARGSLAHAVEALSRRAGAETAIREVVVPGEGGHAPRIRRAARGDAAAFPLSWVNPLGDRQAVETIRAWVAPQDFTPTRVVLGRRNGHGRLAWRVEGRRAGHAELWLLAPNGTLLSHRRR